MNDTILQMKGITKYIFDSAGRGMRESGVKILDHVDFDLRRGEVHILMGENGAGKSTLMKIISGIIPYDEGEMILDGKKAAFKNIEESRRSGIGLIHQELNLCPLMDVGRNMYLGREPKKGPFVDGKKLYEDSRRLLASLGLNVDPRVRVNTLSVSQQQVVEIAKALSLDASVLIMDEPTASLTQNEIRRLFDTIRALRDRGMSVIYISHRFEEIEQIGDRLSVLRDGKYIGTMDVAHYSPDRLINMMVGRSITDMYPRTHTPRDEVVLDVAGFRLTQRTQPLNFQVRAGEIVGFSGLVGAGRTQVCKAIYGAMRYHEGQVTYRGKPLPKNITPRQSIDQGIIYLSEDRKSEGLVIEMSIGRNITLPILKRLFPGGVIRRRAERVEAQKMCGQLRVVCRSIDQKARTLSGGNQQRVVIAKWLATDPKLLILDEPTRGIDIGAKAEIYEIIDNIAAQGVAVIMISSEMPELIGLSDRIYVMKDGTISGLIEDRAEMTQEGLMKYTV